MSKFSETISISIKMLKDPQMILDSERFDSAAESIGVVIKLLEDLQPPRPKCSTCKHQYRNHEHYKTFGCNRIKEFKYRSVDLPRGFGCVHHSDYGVNDGNK